MMFTPQPERLSLEGGVASFGAVRPTPSGAVCSFAAEWLHPREPPPFPAGVEPCEGRFRARPLRLEPGVESARWLPAPDDKAA
jgi:hypothetical protein